MPLGRAPNLTAGSAGMSLAACGQAGALGACAAPLLTARKAATAPTAIARTKPFLVPGWGRYRLIGTSLQPRTYIRNEGKRLHSHACEHSSASLGKGEGRAKPLALAKGQAGWGSRQMGLSTSSGSISQKGSPQEHHVNELRTRVALACRVLGKMELSRALRGHISARIPGTERMFVRARGPAESGVRYTTEDEVVEVD